MTMDHKRIEIRVVVVKQQQLGVSHLNSNSERDQTRNLLTSMNSHKPNVALVTNYFLVTGDCVLTVQGH